ncbi:leucine--tRNA ligase [Spiroplasma turonicum]|uniref:Leucine--tRNA ligase n=1 Tax=Spiroplasma turonicum TaxID=216946 RepID=A0A0K1P7H0_9MOLU|nr:leucine--tRNA ligase [Spiroplasma turonicum]AKU80225.1 leucyl-tRNA synthetase [Spiroplasma turonicum]ALX71225.1 leucyl-tRNA synthetase [Spiroplasma turonicum]
MEYSHKSIEKKWQKFWEENKTYKTTEGKEKKAYILDMFPYPSGAGLHVGHPKGYTATDVFSRMRRSQGYDVLHPIGWDAFGLPAEQYALKTGNDPREFTDKNIIIFREQLKKLGFSYDYEKEVNTSNPNYYKITQFIFQQLYKKGLAEIREANVNWCEGLGTVLANEEVLNINGKMVSDIGGFEVVKKPMKQWVLKITHYADRLLEGLEDLDWPKSVKELQKNWIGKSEGIVIDFVNEKNNISIPVFTTRPDTIYGVTYIVLAPENDLVLKLVSEEQKKEVLNYISESAKKTDVERQDDSKDKTGVFLGTYAINPITNEKTPIYIADYVLNDYATGAVMAVPAHDTRDWKFANSLGLKIKFVLKTDDMSKAFVGESSYINSPLLNNVSNKKEAFNIILKELENLNKGYKKTNYKLRDWLFSRQRFYGEPFPILFTEDNNIALIDEEDLPLELPKTDYIKPSNTGESPLANISDWVNTTYKGKKVRRETNTMPQWAGSCWYYLAYILTKSPNNLIDIKSEEAMELFKKWLPVDLYIGGQEHAVLHLLYARFWHQVLFDIGIVPVAEPFQRLINQGMILADNGEKMSKSKGNVINPDEIIESHGADTLRLYELFMGPLEASLPWSYKGLDGSRKWIDRVYRMIETFELTSSNNGNLDFIYNDVVKKVTNMLEDCKFNTAISQLMVFVNAVYKEKTPIYKNYIEKFLVMFSAFCPHIAEELWEKIGNKPSIYAQSWPIFDENKLVINKAVVAIQINGKLKSTVEVKIGTEKEVLISLAKKTIEKQLQGKNIIKEIAVQDKIVNFVVK